MNVERKADDVFDSTSLSVVTVEAKNIDSLKNGNVPQTVSVLLRARLAKQNAVAYFVICEKDGPRRTTGDDESETAFPVVIIRAADMAVFDPPPQFAAQYKKRGGAFTTWLASNRDGTAEERLRGLLLTDGPAISDLKRIAPLAGAPAAAADLEAARASAALAAGGGQGAAFAAPERAADGTWPLRRGTNWQFPRDVIINVLANGDRVINQSVKDGNALKRQLIDQRYWADNLAGRDAKSKSEDGQYLFVFYSESASAKFNKEVADAKARFEELPAEEQTDVKKSFPPPEKFPGPLLACVGYFNGAGMEIVTAMRGVEQRKDAARDVILRIYMQLSPKSGKWEPAGLFVANTDDRREAAKRPGSSLVDVGGLGLGGLLDHIHLTLFQAWTDKQKPKWNSGEAAAAPVPLEAKRDGKAAAAPAPLEVKGDGKAAAGSPRPMPAVDASISLGGLPVDVLELDRDDKSFYVSQTYAKSNLYKTKLLPVYKDQLEELPNGGGDRVVLFVLPEAVQKAKEAEAERSENGETGVRDFADYAEPLIAVHLNAHDWTIQAMKGRPVMTPYNYRNKLRAVPNGEKLSLHVWPGPDGRGEAPDLTALTVPLSYFVDFYENKSSQPAPLKAFFDTESEKKEKKKKKGAEKKGKEKKGAEKKEKKGAEKKGAEKQKQDGKRLWRDRAWLAKKFPGWKPSNDASDAMLDRGPPPSDRREFARWLLYWGNDDYDNKDKDKPIGWTYFPHTQGFPKLTRQVLQLGPV